jgi:hypothetical protein
MYEPVKSPRSNLKTAAQTSTFFFSEIGECHNQYLENYLNGLSKQAITYASLEEQILELSIKGKKASTSKLLELYRLLTFFTPSSQLLDAFINVLAVSDDPKVMSMAYYFLQQYPPLSSPNDTTAVRFKEVITKELKHSALGRRISALHTYAALCPSDAIGNVNLLETTASILRGEDTEATKTKTLRRRTMKGNDPTGEKALAQYSALIVCRQRFVNNKSLFIPVLNAMCCDDTTGARHAAALTYQYALQSPKDVAINMKHLLPHLNTGGPAEVMRLNMSDVGTRIYLVKICTLLASDPSVDKADREVFRQGLCQFVVDVSEQIGLMAINGLATVIWASPHTAHALALAHILPPVDESAAITMLSLKEKVGVVPAVVTRLVYCLDPRNPLPVLHAAARVAAAFARSCLAHRKVTWALGLQTKYLSVLVPVLHDLPEYCPSTHVHLQALKALVWLATSATTTLNTNSIPTPASSSSTAPLTGASTSSTTTTSSSTPTSQPQSSTSTSPATTTASTSTAAPSATTTSSSTSTSSSPADSSSASSATGPAPASATLASAVTGGSGDVSASTVGSRPSGFANNYGSAGGFSSLNVLKRVVLRELKRNVLTSEQFSDFFETLYERLGMTPEVSGAVLKMALAWFRLQPGKVDENLFVKIWLRILKLHAMFKTAGDPTKVYLGVKIPEGEDLEKEKEKEGKGKDKKEKKDKEKKKKEKIKSSKDKSKDKNKDKSSREKGTEKESEEEKEKEKEKESDEEEEDKAEKTDVKHEENSKSVNVLKPEVPLTAALHFFGDKTLKCLVLRNIFNMLDSDHKFDVADDVWRVKKRIYYFLAEYALVLADLVPDDGGYFRPGGTGSDIKGRLGSSSGLSSTGGAGSGVGLVFPIKAILVRLQEGAMLGPWEVRVVCLEGLAKVAFRSDGALRLHISDFLMKIGHHSFMNCVTSPVLDVLSQTYNYALTFKLEAGKEQSRRTEEESEPLREQMALYGLSYQPLPSQ